MRQKDRRNYRTPIGRATAAPVAAAAPVDSTSADDDSLRRLHQAISVDLVDNLEAGFVLGQWTVIPQQGVLRSDDQEKRLEPKVMDVLVHLARHPADVVTRDQLLEAVWSGMVVGDEALSRAISLLRSQLEDDSRQPVFIQTVPRRGYRLIAAPQPMPATTTEEIDRTPAPAPTAASRRPLEWWRYVVGVALTVALAVIVWRTLSTPTEDPWQAARDSGRPIAIAVLPFTLQGQIPPTHSFVAESLADEIIVALSDIADVRVVARSAAFAAGAEHGDLKALGRLLDVDAVIEGSVRWQNNRARINAHLNGARDGYQIWSEGFESDLQDVFFVQDAISDAVVAALEQSLGRELTRRASGRSTHIPDPAAYELFLRGRLLWKQQGETALRRAIARLREAITIDPEFARAHLALAQAYVELPAYADESEVVMFGRAEAALSTARSLDPKLDAEARSIQGYIASRQLRWEAAQENFEYAVARAPDNAALHNYYSQYLARVGRYADALEHAKLARELDTLSPAINARLAVAYMWVNEHQAAKRQWAIGDELGFRGSEAFRAFWRAYVLQLVREGDADGARDALVRAGLPQELVPALINAFLDDAPKDEIRAAARAMVEASIIPTSMQWPMWIMLDDLDAAFEVFHRLEATPWNIDLEFLFAQETASFRADPRFQELTRHIGLQHYWAVYGAPDAWSEPGK